MFTALVETMVSHIEHIYIYKEENVVKLHKGEKNIIAVGKD